MEDRQRLAPVHWCAWCGGEIYPTEEIWWLGGEGVHEDCLGELARARCPHGYVEKVRKGAVK